MINTTRNRKHRRAAAKPAACAKPLMEQGKEGMEREVGRDEGRDGGRRERKEGTERKGEMKGGR